MRGMLVRSGPSPTSALGWCETDCIVLYPATRTARADHYNQLTHKQFLSCVYLLGMACELLHSWHDKFQTRPGFHTHRTTGSHRHHRHPGGGPWRVLAQQPSSLPPHVRRPRPRIRHANGQAARGQPIRPVADQLHAGRRGRAAWMCRPDIRCISWAANSPAWQNLNVWTTVARRPRARPPLDLPQVRGGGCVHRGGARRRGTTRLRPSSPRCSRPMEQ